MTYDKQHPITPPPEMMRQWREQAPRYLDGGTARSREEWLIELAAQWSADQELEACIAWFDKHIPGYELVADKLRTARRPKPPSLKEQALAALSEMEDDCLMVAHSATVRRALEALPDDL